MLNKEDYIVNKGFIQNNVINVRACYKSQHLDPALYIMEFLTSILATANQYSSRRDA